jgi:hypothetical protein
MTLQDAIKKAYEQRRMVVTNTLVGGVRSYEEYRFQIGQLRGMYELMEDIAGLLRDPDEIEERNDG